MLYIKKIKEKVFGARTKCMFGISRPDKKDEDFDIRVIVDDCRQTDQSHKMSFATFIIISENVPKDFAKKFVANAQSLPMLVGIKLPEDSIVDNYRTLIQMGNKKDYTAEKAQGHIYEEISLEDMKKDDYNRDIYEEFQKYLPKEKEEQM